MPVGLNTVVILLSHRLYESQRRHLSLSIPEDTRLCFGHSLFLQFRCWLLSWSSVSSRLFPPLPLTLTSLAQDNLYSSNICNQRSCSYLLRNGMDQQEAVNSGVYKIQKLQTITLKNLVFFKDHK
jgi:hypothetical protein